ncbi:MAG: TonB-dependent receptor [Candidatus Omnitrophica bacterium]|nr:TonB-dependent receptor [Candidatus Omnitrophota bacterium]
MKAIFLALVLTVSVRLVYAENVELERIVVTPTRMVQEDYKTGSNITVIDSKSIGSSNAQNVADILKEEAGIHYYDNSSAKTATVDIRGFGDTAGRNVLLLVDGRKVNPADISGPDWLQLPLESVERIEIIRGAGSVLYGDNAVGGVVNVITKKGNEGISGKAGIMAASYDSYQEDVEILGETGKFSHYLYLKHYDSDGYRSNSNVNTKDCNTKLGYEFSEDLSFELTAGWHEDDYGLPGGLDDQGELTQYGRRGSPDESDFASTKDRYVNLSLDLRPWFDVTDSAHFNVDVFYRNRDSYSWLDYGGWPSAQKYMIDTEGATVKYTYDGSIGDKELNFVIGMDYYDIENMIKGSEWNSDDLTIFKEEMGFYGYSEYEMFKNLFINSGARYQKAEYIFDQRASTVRRETKEPTESMFMAGLKYEYSDDSSVHLSMQESFRFLATDEWYSTWSGLNTSLRQQTGTQYEVGIRHNFDDAAIVTVTPYWIDIKDEIYVNPYPSPGQNENYDKTRRKGVELGVDLDLSNFIDLPYVDKPLLHANYTCQQAKFKGGDYGSNDIPMTPMHQAVASLSAKLCKDYNLSLTGRYVGERYAINDTRNETSKMKDFFTLDSRFSYGKDSIEIYAGVNNIFDEKYFTYAAKSSSSNKKDYYPAPERNFEMGASYKF